MASSTDPAADEAAGRAYRAGRAAWPGIHLPEVSFRQYLERISPHDPSQLGGDLYLACACTLGDPGALAAVEVLASPMIARLAKRWRHTPIDPSDVAQALRERLFVGDGSGPPRIEQYAGQSPLRHWLRVVAARLMVDLARPLADQAAHAEDERLMPLLDLGTDPELAEPKQEYQAAVKEAFVHALARLSSSQRACLRMRFADRLPLDEISRHERLPRAQVAETLGRARDVLIEAIEDELGHSLGGEDPTEALALVRSRLTSRFERLLTDDPAA